ncbi:MAG: GspE/PulE family protein [Patescibacteria group bacterium]|nr:GspE/PulE family protein [Patescibacteria group bacterium]
MPQTKLEKKVKKMAATKILNALLECAIFENASNIHLEPREDELAVRYRVDGVLREVMTLPRQSLAGLVARIKILANLKPSEHRRPQDGHFQMKTNDHRISFHVSIIPVSDGEKVVLRLLNESSSTLTLAQLGFQPSILETIKRNIKKPSGLILVTGPAHSGKTTALYVILNLLNKPGAKIATIEDQSEYCLPRVQQSQINHKIGYTFASGLRALLRQNPKIIMVGEIEDQKTAELALHAAITGHQLFSTLPAKNTTTALSHLINMKIEPFLIASATNVIIAERLVRKICENCRAAHKPSKKMIAELEKNFKHDELKKISQRFYIGKGCQKCGKTGYVGRIGVFEVLEIDTAIGEMIMKNIPAEKIRQKAKEKGLLTLAEDALLKAKEGITTLEEVIRVVKE